MVAALGAATLAACGGDDGPKPFAAKQVAAAFTKVTGDRLVTDAGAGAAGTTVLSLDRGAGDQTVLADRYGTFTIFVADGDDETSLKALYAGDPSSGGGEIRPDRAGIYWQRLGTGTATFQAAKRYRNVVLQWQAGREQKTDARFARLDGALTTLVKRGQPALPPEDRPCEQQGIDLSGGDGEGTCKEGAQTLVVADRGHTLELGDASIRGLRIRTQRKIQGAGAYGQSLTARGRFAVLRYRLVNHGTEPIPRLTAGLRIGERAYAVSDTAELILRSRDPFPLQPGGATEIISVFELPESAAKKAPTRGALLVSLDPDAATIAASGTVGWLRLVRASDR